MREDSSWIIHLNYFVIQILTPIKFSSIATDLSGLSVTRCIKYQICYKKGICFQLQEMFSLRFTWTRITTFLESHLCNLTSSVTHFNAKDGSSIFLWNTGIHVLDYFVSQPRRPQPEELPPWILQNIWEMNISVKLSKLHIWPLGENIYIYLLL
jgi:hypothetical protein